MKPATRPLSGYDVNGQTTRLRANDGINFTPSGRAKLTFYAEQAIHRSFPVAYFRQTSPATESVAPIQPGNIQRIANDGKSALIAYILWFFFSGLGGHCFYLGYIRLAVAMLVMSVLGFVLTVSGTVTLNSNSNAAADTAGACDISGWLHPAWHCAGLNSC